MDRGSNSYRNTGATYDNDVIISNPLMDLRGHHPSTFQNFWYRI